MVANFPVFRAHDAVEHVFVHINGETVSRRLIKFVKESIIVTLGILERLYGHVVVLKYYFVENLVENLPLQTEDGLVARHADCLWNNEGTLFAEHDLFKVHARQILLLPDIVGRYEVEEGVAAQRVHL